MKIDKGDFLTFASLAAPFDLLSKHDLDLLEKCEIEKGILRRHPELTSDDSRSDISRDGYLGHLYRLLKSPEEIRNQKLDEVIQAIKKTKGQVGDDGDFCYTNIWPLIFIYLAARHGKKIPTPPIIVIKPIAIGFRAHLAALYINLEMLIGKKRLSHRYNLKKLVKYNPTNPWFYALHCKSKGKKVHLNKFNNMIANLDASGDADTGWGGCPNLVLIHLARAAKE